MQHTKETRESSLQFWGDKFYMLPEAERKKYSKLDEDAWRKVKIFVDGYFQQQERATNATYHILFRAISDQYPDIVLERQTFTKKIASIEVLKSRAGIFIHAEPLSKDRRSLLKDTFVRVLNGLTLPEFKTISVGELVERAHRSNPDLRINEINKNTLAKHFSFKALKALAGGQRPAETPVPLGHSAQVVEAPCPQSLESAAGVDGPPLLNRRAVCRRAVCRRAVCRRTVCRRAVCGAVRRAVCRRAVCRRAVCRLVVCRLAVCRLAVCRCAVCRRAVCRLAVCRRATHRELSQCVGARHTWARCRKRGAMVSRSKIQKSKTRMH